MFVFVINISYLLSFCYFQEQIDTLRKSIVFDICVNCLYPLDPLISENNGSKVDK